MKIIADENIPLVHEVFGELGEVTTYSGRSIHAEHVRDADVLLVRSVTKVNEALLKGSRVKFVGTCTIGTDHIDLAYLHSNKIGFSAAPGCNANAVVDYVVSALVVLSTQQAFDLQDRCVGIVGVGNVGSRLKGRLEAMGVRCLCTDPLHDDQNIPGLVHFEELLEEADIISLHTPLTTEGAHPTYHLFDKPVLSQLNPGCILINSARGSVIDNRALLEVLEDRKDLTAVLDVWEGEPDISLPLLARVALGTPHIAGYSLDGKINGTRMVYDSLCQFFGVEQSVDIGRLAPPVTDLDVADCCEFSLMEKASNLVLKCYDIRDDDVRFREVMIPENSARSASFDALRKNYPVRRELGVTGVRTGEGEEQLRLALRAYGFKC